MKSGGFRVLVVASLMMSGGSCFNIFTNNVKCLSDLDCPTPTPFCVGSFDGVEGFCDAEDIGGACEMQSGFCGNDAYCDPFDDEADADGCTPCDCNPEGCYRPTGCGDFGACFYEVNPAFQCPAGQRCDPNLREEEPLPDCVDAPGTGCEPDGSDGGCGPGLFCFSGGCSGLEFGTCTALDAPNYLGGPVCGCDGVTYGSRTEAQLASMDATEGACPTAVPCTEQGGCEGNEYCRFAALTCGGDGFCAARIDDCSGGSVPDLCACGIDSPLSDVCAAHGMGANVFSDDDAECTGGGPLVIDNVFNDAVDNIMSYRVQNRGSAPLDLNGWVFNIVDGTGSYTTFIEMELNLGPGEGATFTTDAVTLLSFLPDVPVPCEPLTEVTNAPAVRDGTQGVELVDDMGVVRDRYGPPPPDFTGASYLDQAVFRDDVTWSNGGGWKDERWTFDQPLFDIGPLEPNCP